MLSAFTAVASAIRATTKKGEKERLLADYFRRLDDAELERAAVFFTGSPFPRKDERVTKVGWNTIFDVVAAVAGAEPEALGAASRHHGDLGDAVAEFFPETGSRDPTLVEVGEEFDALAATGGKGSSEERYGILSALYRGLGRDGARFVTKILTGEFRIGLQQGLVESAIAKAFDHPLPDIRRAHMFTADLGMTALLAKSGALGDVGMALFHPFDFMLAQPEERPEDIVALVGSDAFADDKYDGIRAQIHCDRENVKIYSRTLDEIGARFPELQSASLAMEHSFILDGEIVAFREGVLPFAALQPRIGRRKLTDEILESTPVVFFAFDLLYFDGRPLFETPLRDRLILLASLLSPGSAIRAADRAVARDGPNLDVLFDAARSRGNEGLVVKAADSLYAPGRRGKSWLKYKKALATLDCVVTAAEYGHGKRRGVLSDYTFAIRSGDKLLNIGKAYSGLTDAEIDELTTLFKSIATGTFGPVHAVRPQVVLEIAFDRIQESKRHKSGFALRFPRIARIRDDKSVDQISTIDDVRRIYEGQVLRERKALEGGDDEKR